MAQGSKVETRAKTGNTKIEYLVSACLIGKPCFYDGTSRVNESVKALFEAGKAKALCPEELGGLKTPRPPAEIFGGTGEEVLSGKAFVYNGEGRELTFHFLSGSRQFLTIANEYGVKKAVLKARSPCCGIGKIYDGTFSNTLTKGNGVTAALLLKNGFEVFSDEAFSKAVAGARKRTAKKQLAKGKKSHVSKKAIRAKRKKR